MVTFLDKLVSNLELISLAISTWAWVTRAKVATFEVSMLRPAEWGEERITKTKTAKEGYLQDSVQ
jgi:hypothetical protein